MTWRLSNEEMAVRYPALYERWKRDGVRVRPRPPEPKRWTMGQFDKLLEQRRDGIW